MSKYNVTNDNCFKKPHHLQIPPQQLSSIHHQPVGSTKEMQILQFELLTQHPLTKSFTANINPTDYC